MATISEGQAVPPPPPAAQPPVEPMKRPLGLSIISILWLLGGLVNLYIGLNTVIADIGVLPYLSYPAMPPWFQFGVPAEIAIFSVGLIIVPIQLATIYGLWAGKSWSYKPALAIPILNAAIGFADAALIYSAPASLELASSPVVLGTLIGTVVGGILWVIIYWSYLRRPHVKAYLKIKK